MNKKTLTIIIVVAVIISLIILGISIYFLVKHKRKQHYEKLQGGLYNKYDIDTKKVNFFAKNKALFITQIKQENDILIYEVIEIYNRLVDILYESKSDNRNRNTSKDDLYDKVIKNVFSENHKSNKNDNLFICGLSLERFKKIYNSIDESEQYKIYLKYNQI